MADTSHLYTTVKNPGTASRFFGYLGAHGKRLNPGSTYTFFGDIGTQLYRGNGGRVRKRAKFESDLLANRVEVIRTPRPVMKDATSNAVKVLNLTGGALGVLDPSWGAYTAAAGD